MLGILNFTAAPKGTNPAGQGGSLSPNGTQGASFGALMTQVLSGEGTQLKTDSKSPLSQLATMLGKFRAEAQESLSDVFPDGVIVPGPEFNEWAASMMTKLDGMLQGLGLGIPDLAMVLAPVDGLTTGDAGTMLTQAAQMLMQDVGEGIDGLPDGVEGKDLATLIKGLGLGSGAQGADGQSPAEIVLPDGVDLPEGLDPEALSELAELGDTAELRAAISSAVDTTTAEGRSLAETIKAAALGQAADVRAGVAELQGAAPMPDALRMILAQAVGSPADRGLPPEIQAILSPAQQPAPAVTATLAAAAPAQPAPTPAQNNGFARNLAGQIRGVSFTEGTTRIELTPQGLGKLEIEIAPDEAGKLRVVIRAENPAVLNAMRSDRDMLAGLLRDGGASVDDGAMSFEDLGQRGGTTGRGTAPDQGTLAVGMGDDDEEVAQVAATVDDGRLNILT